MLNGDTTAAKYGASHPKINVRTVQYSTAQMWTGMLRVRWIFYLRESNMDPDLGLDSTLK